MTSDPIRWGILSTGHIAGVFADDLRLLPDHRITAVASRTQAKADRFVAEHAHGARAHPAYQQRADDPDVDIVYVATPHSEHHANVTMLLQAGKHVLCEKAITVNAGQLEDLIALAAQRQLFLMEAMWMRTNPLHHRLVELVRGGAIGTVHAVSAELGFNADPDPAGRLRNPDLAGGALLDMGIYPITFAFELLGAPTTIAAHSIRSGQVDGTTGLVFGYPDATAIITTSIDAHMPARGVVMGSDGWIELDQFHATEKLVVHRPEREDELVSVEWPGAGYTYEAEEAARCVRAGLAESQQVPLADSLAIIGILDQIRSQIGLVYPFETDPAGAAAAEPGGATAADRRSGAERA
jgi:predicted dehydrogenase